MSVELEKKIAELTAENKSLQESLHANNVKDVQARAEKAEADKAKADELLKAAQDSMAKVTAEAEKVKSEAEAIKVQLAEANAKIESQQAELGQLYAEQTKQARLSIVKEKLNFSEAFATKFVDTNITLSKEQFDAQVAVLVEAQASAVTNNPQSGNTSFSGPAAKSAPKATPAPLPPKATSLPAPMAGKASEEDDAAGEVAADAANLENAEASQNDAALSATSSDSGVDEVAKSIAAYLGCEAKEQE